MGSFPADGIYLSNALHGITGSGRNPSAHHGQTPVEYSAVSLDSKKRSQRVRQNEDRILKPDHTHRGLINLSWRSPKGDLS